MFKCTIQVLGHTLWSAKPGSNTLVTQEFYANNPGSGEHPGQPLAQTKSTKELRKGPAEGPTSIQNWVAAVGQELETKLC
eukprot:1146738-Pelagomonas_calceolata.AAC.3